MTLNDLMTKFSELDDEMKDLCGKYGVCQKEQSELNMEEKFICDELSGILEVIEEIEDTIKYLNRAIVAEGTLSARKGRFYINDYQIRDFEYIEFILDGNWVKTDISLINGEYYIDLYGKSLSRDEIYARVRGETEQGARALDLEKERGTTPETLY